MKIAFSGCRDKEVSFVFLDMFYSTDVSVLVGDCPTGIDKCVREWAKATKVSYTVYKADWDTYGKAAGPMRNEVMVKDADCVIALWDGKSRGTKSTIKLALKYKVNLEVIFIEDD